MLLLPVMSCDGVTSIGSDARPITTNLPFGPKPSIKADIAFELGAVARITCAPPSFSNSCAALDFSPSMYTLAPSFLQEIQSRRRARSLQRCNRIYLRIECQGGPGRRSLESRPDRRA